MLATRMLEVREGVVACPLRGALDVERCPACSWYAGREGDAVVCRAPEGWGREASDLPPPA